MLVPAHAVDPLLILLIALAVDALAGDPGWLWRAVPHPAALLGRAVGLLDRASASSMRWPAARSSFRSTPRSRP